jgi:hypothetical protein
MQKLQENLVHQFTWVAKEAYIGAYMVKRYTPFINYIKDMDMVSLIGALEKESEKQNTWLRRSYNIRTKSTCELTQVSSTWEYECELLYANDVDKVLRIIKRKLELVSNQ